MSFGKLLVILVIAGLGYQFWYKPRAAQRLDADIASASSNGFLRMPPPSNVDPDKVLIVAAENCPEDSAQRAEAMAQQLASRGIPFTRAHRVNFSFSNADPSLVNRVMSVMNGQVPIVLVNGRGKSNPSLEEVVAEYKSVR